MVALTMHWKWTINKQAKTVIDKTFMQKLS